MNRKELQEAISDLEATVTGSGFMPESVRSDLESLRRISDGFDALEQKVAELENERDLLRASNDEGVEIVSDLREERDALRGLVKTAQRDVHGATVPPEVATLEAKVADLLAGLREESVRKSALAVEAFNLSQQVKSLEAQVLKCAEETQKACARADKAEADLASCLAVTNEVLEEALAQGREARAQAERYEAVMRKAADLIDAGGYPNRAAAADNLRNAINAEAARSALICAPKTLPLPCDEVKT